MSNFLSVAAVTGTLQRVLQNALDAEPSPNAVGGAKVSSARPGSADVTKVGVNLFLYQVVPNAAFRNADTPTRDANGALVQRPRTALNLHYLLTFHGAEKTLEPQRLLGATVRTVHGGPVLTPAQIDATRADAQFSYMSDSDISAEIERVKLTPLSLTFDELSRIWAVFPTTDYALSVAYEASVVFIEGTSLPRASQPVAERTVTVFPTGPAAIDAVEALGGGPVLPTSTLALIGRGLQADDVRVRIAGTEVVPVTVRPTVVTVDLVAVAAAPGATLAAGVQGAQVIQPLLLGKPPAPHPPLESNVAPFVLHPVVALKGNGQPDIDVSNQVTDPDGTRRADVAVGVQPPVQPGQRLRLLLDEQPPPAGAVALAYAFDLDAPAVATPKPVFAVAGVTGGPYIARVSVDGAETLPTRDDAGLATAPVVTV